MSTKILVFDPTSDDSRIKAEADLNAAFSEEYDLLSVTSHADQVVVILRKTKTVAILPRIDDNNTKKTPGNRVGFIEQ